MSPKCGGLSLDDMGDLKLIEERIRVVVLGKTIIFCQVG